MFPSTRLALLLALALLAPGCRQADGPLPQPANEQTNEIGDIARDMANVVNKDPQGPEDLKGDLAKYANNDDARVRIDALADNLVQALGSARLDDATAQRLAHTLWVGITATELSERQVEVLERELKGILSSAGVPDDRAQPVADRLGAVQEVVTLNPKRWYQVF
jgi:hypothetical protein